jgi:hypothetical protein
VRQLVKRVVADRVKGKRASVPSALIAAAVAGLAAASLTYRALRS